MSVNPGFQAAEQRRGYLQSVAENNARYASAFVSFKTTGWGEFQSPDAQRFTTTFIKRPSVAHSLSVDGDKLVKGRFPRVTAGVHEWLRDSNGFYIGAWLFFVVETLGLQDQKTFVMPTSATGTVNLVSLPTPAVPDPKYDLIHDFTFTGVAMKALPSNLLDA